MQKKMTKNRLIKNLIFVIIFLLTCCGISKNIYLEYKTPEPQLIVDSLYNKYNLIDTSKYENWHKIQYFGSDSIITNTYTEIFQIEDSLYIISITEKENQDTVLLRFRKEIK